MSGNQPGRSTETDANLEREIRAERKFTLAEAIGRIAGPGMMKGVSPVSGMQQAVAEIQSYLSRHSGGDLPWVFLRHVKESELLLHGFRQPLVVLADCVQKVLDSEYLLKELVRQADVEWGREFGERPYFENDGCPPHPDDPHTVESVRTALTQLARALAAGEA
jgi:hypothetical protein